MMRCLFACNGFTTTRMIPNTMSANRMRCNCAASSNTAPLPSRNVLLLCRPSCYLRRAPKCKPHGNTSRRASSKALSPFTTSPSMDVWAVAASNTYFSKLVNAAMAFGSRLSLLALLQHYVDGFRNGIRTIVDVGGGVGLFVSLLQPDSMQERLSLRFSSRAITDTPTSMDHSGQRLHRYLHVQKLPLRVCCIQEDGVSQTSMSMEPKWKQKLAAADNHAERTRQKTLLAQEEYKQKQAAMQRLQADTSKEVLPLEDLEFLPYLSEDGLITDCSAPNAKASVYAIFDCDKVLQYVGISRQVHSSMRLHFARIPLKCYYVKIQNITKPSRSLLELVREKWFKENGTRPSGNDNGPEQNVWENPLDCKPLMTDEEKDKWEAAGAGPHKAKVLKNVARRVEAQLEEGFRGRCCKERLRFDPKLKERGLLDLKNV